MSKNDHTLPRTPSPTEVDAFLQEVARTPAAAPATLARGRLLFAMDATASREPSWEQARRIQSEMFLATSTLGGLDIQLCFYRGLGECRASPWLGDADALLRRMTEVRCIGGLTQIGKVLQHTIDETSRHKVNALVFVGDCVEEDVDRLSHLAGKLGLLGVPAFVFQEGNDPEAARAFRQIAHLSGGAYSSFDAHSAEQLRQLLGAVAVYAAGGHQALQALEGRRSGLVRQLSHQLRR